MEIECISCAIIGSINEGFANQSQVIFENLATGVVRVGASVATLVLIIALMFKSQFGLTV